LDEKISSSQKGSQKSSQKILALISENAKVTTQEMSNSLGYGDSYGEK